MRISRVTAVVGVLAVGLGVWASPVMADSNNFSSRWTLGTSYSGGGVVYYNTGLWSDLATTRWDGNYTVGDMLFEANFANMTISNAPSPDFIRPWGWPSDNITTTYGQTVTVVAGAGALNSFSFYVKVDSAAGPGTAQAVVFPWDVAGNRAAGPAVFISNPFTVAPDIGVEQKVTVNTGGLGLVEGQVYVLALTTLTGWYDAPEEDTPIVIQQVGLPSSGKCDAIDRPDLNWSGVASGGWTQSWAQWRNEGKGGPICTRTLKYSNALRGWFVVAA